MRDVMLLGARLVLGSYLSVHGAQQLFGAFGGPGLEQAGAGFERIGLTPGRPMAALAGSTEFGGGLLTAAGVADPAGPLAIMGVALGLAELGVAENLLDDADADALLVQARPGQASPSPARPSRPCGE
jgi:uncharacterized membrane protein YphA (DoxX/SURF4 family)